jgi:nicotinamidase-related amidase
MADGITMNKGAAALLSMDFQNDILGNFQEPQRGALVTQAAANLAAARKAGLTVAHVAVRFRPGHPEVSPRNMRFSDAKKANRLVDGTPGAAIHEALAPQGSEVQVTKVRVGAFSTTHLETVMRARDITTLVLQGIITSGVILSTVRWAADMDYRILVLSDACADPDAEVHRVLMEKVFPKQATVINSAQFMQALA